MREPSYFILAALLPGPRHGYAIIKLAEELSGGSVRLATGTLYAAIDRLGDAGLLEAVKQEVVDGRARQYYALTPAGHAALRAEADRMASAAKVVTDDRRRAGRPGVAPA
jgi:DNA-binding PadR family transcriptional regulator